MKKKYFLLLFSVSLFFSNAQESMEKKPKFFGKEIAADKISSSGYIKCITDEYEQYLQERNSGRLTNDRFEEWLAPLIERYKNSRQLLSPTQVIYIPVVVHVIHNGDPYGTEENITDEQVESQITVMNQDFRKMTGTSGYNSNPVGADIMVEFVLAKVDPNGNPTNGIDRVNMCQESWSTSAIDDYVKPNTIWDPNLYMNMWSVNFSSGSLLGYATFPSGSGLDGLTSGYGTDTTDGVVSGYRFFGSSDLTSGNFYPPYDKGRTMTHEVGHFLGLRHIWGDGNCSVDDFCLDTPNAAAANYGCNTTDSCPDGQGNDMIENYMDYTDDLCMNIFTNDQKLRILAVMDNSPRRVSLKTSPTSAPIPLFANDAEVKIENYCTGGACNPTHKILLYNRGTSDLTAATLTYNVDGGGNYNYSWSGIIEPDKYELITIYTTETTGVLNISLASVNGGVDERSSNNNSSKVFDFGQLPTDYPFENFVFNLVGDRWGSETTWDLKDSNGVVLYSGGPYTNKLLNGTQNLVTNMVWNLPYDGCYNFTINDSYGDGICCTSGAGNWSITTDSGAITVGSGGSFSFAEYLSLSTTVLSNDAFETNDFTLYPNPAENILNVSIPLEITDDLTYEVYNNLGQILKVGKVTQKEFILTIGDWHEGVYFIKLRSENSSSTLRFVKN